MDPAADDLSGMFPVPSEDGVTFGFFFNGYISCERESLPPERQTEHRIMRSLYAPGAVRHVHCQNCECGVSSMSDGI